MKYEKDHYGRNDQEAACAVRHLLNLLQKFFDSKWLAHITIHSGTQNIFLFQFLLHSLFRATIGISLIEMFSSLRMLVVVS
jgi:hypothetical protein